MVESFPVVLLRKDGLSLSKLSNTKILLNDNHMFLIDTDLFSIVEAEISNAEQIHT